jgi:dienelactone hydrolase
VLGLSHGGSTAALATEHIYEGFGIRAAVDYYGACVDAPAHGTVPLLALAGDLDDWGHPASRCEAYGIEVGSNQPFEIHTYPGVYHGFDNPDFVGTVVSSHILQYNRAAAEDSYVRVHDFLDHWIKQGTDLRSAASGGHGARGMPAQPRSGVDQQAGAPEIQTSQDRETTRTSHRHGSF